MNCFHKKKIYKFINTAKKAFSLIELSICIMISGIMAAAAVVSYDTVKQARAQAVISQFQKYRSAINDFYKLYGYLPGDLPDAQYRFSSKDYITSSLDDINSLTPAEREKVVLNGAGVGYIFGCAAGTNVYVYSDNNLVWSHLSSSGFLSEKYLSINENCVFRSFSSSTCLQGGINIPTVEYTDDYNGVWNFRTLSRAVGTSDMTLGAIYSTTDAYKYNVLEIVSFQQTKSKYSNTNNTGLDCYNRRDGYQYPATTHFETAYGGISNDMMAMIDVKIDDGRPLSGNVFANNSMQVNAYVVETTPCINTGTGTNVNVAVDKNATDFSLKNTYTTNKDARCVGVFILPELG